jgi:hypothetical protein
MQEVWAEHGQATVVPDLKAPRAPLTQKRSESLGSPN